MKPSVNSPEFRGAISVAKMRESDKYTIENFVPGHVLMHRAAMGIFNSSEWSARRIAIVCGSGNNGGDGYALAEILAQRKIMPDIFRLSEKFSADGRRFFERAKALGVRDISFTADTNFAGYDVIVDCILGTGFRGTPEGLCACAINAINSAGAYVISADINSGLDGDTGIAALAVRSDLTVSIGSYKTGLFLNDAPSLIGDLVNADIGIEII